MKYLCFLSGWGLIAACIYVTIEYAMNETPSRNPGAAQTLAIFLGVLGAAAFLASLIIYGSENGPAMQTSNEEPEEKEAEDWE